MLGTFAPCANRQGESLEDWLSDTACSILVTAHDPGIGRRAAALIPVTAPNRRQNAVIVAVANDLSPPVLGGRLLDGTDPLARVGAAAAANMLATDAAVWTALLGRARADRDLTVRFAAGGDESVASTAAGWSCLDCSNMNDIAATRCA
jgi:hypothetical protein